jgi:hypothetical protein
VVFAGDLDAATTRDDLLRALDTAQSSGAPVVLLVLSGNLARRDLLLEVLQGVRRFEGSLAVYLADPEDGRVGPGQVAIALAADRASIAPGTRVQRAFEDDLSLLNPEVEDWAVLNLDLRAVGGEIAAGKGMDPMAVESLLAPRSDVWAVEDGGGRLNLVADAPASGEQVVQRTPAGWSFLLDAESTARVFGLGLHRNGRQFLLSLGHRGRPDRAAEVSSPLRALHARCRVLVDRCREAIGLAEGALDVRATRRGQSSILPRDYHAAAERASVLVAECRAAIGEIEAASGAYPELLHLDPPADADTPTQIGGPSRSSLAAWREAVRDAERDLAALDERIAEYRRR